MITKDKIQHEIMEITSHPMTPEGVGVLADLLYISRHWEDTGSGEPKENEGVVEPLTREQASHWVGSMENADGTTGQHWTMEGTEGVRMKLGLTCDPVQFWATMNMMYSDYCMAAGKLGISNVDFYARMAEAFLDDKDACPDKLARYYAFIAEH